MLCSDETCCKEAILKRERKKCWVCWQTNKSFKQYDIFVLTRRSKILITKNIQHQGFASEPSTHYCKCHDFTSRGHNVPIGQMCPSTNLLFAADQDCVLYLLYGTPRYCTYVAFLCFTDFAVSLFFYWISSLVWYWFCFEPMIASLQDSCIAWTVLPFFLSHSILPIFLHLDSLVSADAFEFSATLESTFHISDRYLSIRIFKQNGNRLQYHHTAHIYTSWFLF